MEVLRDTYLELLKQCLHDIVHGSQPGRPDAASLTADEYRDWLRTQRTLTEHAETMIGLKRLDNLQDCVEQVIQEGVPGDLIEAGVWRGGATILMRAILMAYDVNDRVVWVADSFEGLPPPNPLAYPADAGATFHERKELAASLDQVKGNFARYGLLDQQVRFIKGWFRDTLSSAPIKELAVLRLDCDMYESTMDSLNALYPKLNPGGYVIIDDYGMFEACRRAVDDYRSRQGIADVIIPIDSEGVYWKKSPRLGATEAAAAVVAKRSPTTQVPDRTHEVEILRARVAEQEDAIRALTNKVAQINQALREVHASRAWRLITALRRIRVALVPPGSLRERIWYSVLDSGPRRPARQRAP